MSETKEEMKSVQFQAKKLEQITKNVSSNVEKITQLETVGRSFCSGMRDLEDRSRRNNLLIYGLDESQDERSILDPEEEGHSIVL